MTEELLESWRTNHRANLMLIDAIGEEGTGCTLPKKGLWNLGRGSEVTTCVL